MKKMTPLKKQKIPKIVNFFYNIGSHDCLKKNTKIGQNAPNSVFLRPPPPLQLRHVQVKFYAKVKKGEKCCK